MSTILNLQKWMRSFPELLKQHFVNNDVLYTKADYIRILSCFSNGAIIIDGETVNFEDFHFLEGDIVLIQQMAEYTRNNEHSFEDCNPNAAFPTISTLVGRLYTFNEAESGDIQGMGVIKFKLLCVLVVFG